MESWSGGAQGDKHRIRTQQLLSHPASSVSHMAWHNRLQNPLKTIEAPVLGGNAVLVFLGLDLCNCPSNTVRGSAVSSVLLPLLRLASFC